MKTAIEIPDELYRRAKSEAALRGRKLRNLVEEGLRLVLEGPRKTRRRPSLAGLAKGARHDRLRGSRLRFESQASGKLRPR